MITELRIFFSVFLTLKRETHFCVQLLYCAVFIYSFSLRWRQMEERDLLESPKDYWVEQHRIQNELLYCMYFT